ncbi:MAG: hypothetical protein LBK76_01245 [Verrucomicrobiales bacterium]|jgi:hypothetical protein|nr:hypothetical protein [Verrucomicrobiales bacterium]
MPTFRPFDLDQFLLIAWDLLQQALFTPQSMREFLLSCSVGLILLSVCLAQAHSLGNVARSSAFAGAFAVIPGVCLLLAGGALAQLYVTPFISSNSHDASLVIGAVALVFLVLVVPLTRGIFRAGYLASLGAWLVAAMVAGALVFGVHTLVRPNADDRPPACPFAVSRHAGR